MKEFRVIDTRGTFAITQPNLLKKRQLIKISIGLFHFSFLIQSNNGIIQSSGFMFKMKPWFPLG